MQKTLKRLEDKMQGRVLQYLIYLMRTSDRDNQQRIAVALAHLCSEAGEGGARQPALHRRSISPSSSARLHEHSF